MAANWAVVDARNDLITLYNETNAEGAMEWQAIKFWHAFLEAWKDHSGKAITITDQSPPDQDPNSEYRLRRIDVIVDGYTNQEKKRFTILIVEVKGAHVNRSEYRTVEDQAQGACEAYLNAPGNMTTMIYAMCAVGTHCRMFRYTGNFDWEPMWGEDTEYDRGEYIDAADRTKGSLVWRALNVMLQQPPTELADKAYL